jgi:hypothetical protein
MHFPTINHPVFVYLLHCSTFSLTDIPHLHVTLYILALFLEVIDAVKYKSGAMVVAGIIFDEACLKAESYTVLNNRLYESFASNSSTSFIHGQFHAISLIKLFKLDNK